MGDTRKSVPSFSSFTFKTIGSNSLLSRISDRSPEAVAATTVEQDEDGLYVDTDVDLPEPPDVPPSLLARFSDQLIEVDSLRSTVFHPNGTYSPLFLTPGPVQYKTVLNGNDLNEPACLDVASFDDENIKERSTDPAEQEQNSQALFPIRPEQRSPATNLALPSQTSIGLLTPPPSGLLASSPVNWSIPFADQASLLPKSNGSVDSLFPFTPLTKLLQEERDAWSEVLQTKQAQVDKAPTCTQSLDTNERDIRAGQTDDDHSCLSGPAIPSSLPWTLLSCLPSQSQQSLPSSKGAQGAEIANDKAELCLSRIPASSHDSSNSRAAFRSCLNASKRASDRSNGDSVPQQNSKVYPEQPLIQFTDAAKPPSPREKELKSLLKARATSHCSKSDRASDGGTYPIHSRLSPTAAKHENNTRPNDPANSERASTTDSFEVTEFPTSPFVKTDMPSSHIVPSTNLQRLQNDGLKIRSPQSLRPLSTRIHSEFSLPCSSIATIQQDPIQPKPRDGWMKESLGSETSRISSQVSKASVLAPNPVLCDPPVTSESHDPHSRVTSFTSSDGGEAKGAADPIPVVKTEDSDGGFIGPTMDTSTKIKKEEQEDIKIQLKVEEDSKPLLKDKSVSQILARDCPKAAKKEEDHRDGMLILSNANAQALSRKKSTSQAEHHRKTAHALVHQDDIRQIDRHGGATVTSLAINKPTDNTEPSRSLGTQSENTLSAREPVPADSLIQAEQAIPRPFSRDAAVNDSMGTEQIPRDLSEQVPSTASQNATAQLVQPEPFSINDNSYRSSSPRRKADSWVPETSRHERQRSRDRERPPHLLDHWSPPRLSAPRAPAPVRSRPVADTYRPPISSRGRVPRKFRDDLRDEHDEDRLSRRPREGRARFSPEYLPGPPFRARSSSPKRTDRNRARDSPPHRNTCAFDTRFATIPRPCSPHTSRSHVGYEVGQEHNNRNMSPRREFPRSPPANNTQHNLYSNQSTALRESEDASRRDSRYLQQHAHGAAQGLPSPERRFVPNAPYMRATENERRTSIHDIDVAKNAVNGRHETSTNPWNEGTFYTDDQSSQDPCSKTAVRRDEMNTSADRVPERREGTIGSSNSLIPPAQSHTTMSLSVQPSRSYISELRFGTVRDLSNAQPATKHSISNRSEEDPMKNVSHEVVESNDTATSHIYGRHEESQSQTGNSFRGCRVEKDVRPSHGMAEPSPLSPSGAQNVTEHNSLPSSNTPMLNRLSTPASSPKKQAVKGSGSRIHQTSLSSGTERSGQTSSVGKAEEKAKSRSLAQRIDDDPAGSIAIQQLEDFKESNASTLPRSPIIPSLSSRLGDILIHDGSDHSKERAAFKPAFPPSDLPLGSRITDVKLESRQARHPLPPKPVPHQSSPTTITQDPRSTINPPVLLKRMRSLEIDNSDSYRPVKQSRGRGAAGGRGRGRGNNGRHYSPQGSVHASPSSKRSLEDRLS